MKRQLLIVHMLNLPVPFKDLSFGYKKLDCPIKSFDLLICEDLLHDVIFASVDTAQQSCCNLLLPSISPCPRYSAKSLKCLFQILKLSTNQTLPALSFLNQRIHSYKPHAITTWRIVLWMSRWLAALIQLDYPQHMQRIQNGGIWTAGHQEMLSLDLPLCQRRLEFCRWGSPSICLAA